MATIYVNYGSFDTWAGKLDAENTKLRDKLTEIQNKIKGIEATYQSNASTAIRDKINGMTPRFDQYQEVVGKYSAFIRKTAQEYKTTEDTTTNNANQFI